MPYDYQTVLTDLKNTEKVKEAVNNRLNVKEPSTASWDLMDSTFVFQELAKRIENEKYYKEKSTKKTKQGFPLEFTQFLEKNLKQLAQDLKLDDIAKQVIAERAQEQAKKEAAIAQDKQILSGILIRTLGNLNKEGGIREAFIKRNQQMFLDHLPNILDESKRQTVLDELIKNALEIIKQKELQAAQKAELEPPPSPTPVAPKPQRAIPLRGPILLSEPLKSRFEQYKSNQLSISNKRFQPSSKWTISIALYNTLFNPKFHQFNTALDQLIYIREQIANEKKNKSHRFLKGELEKILEAAEQEILTQLKENPREKAIADLIIYIEIAQANKVEERSLWQPLEGFKSLRSDQKAKIKAARTIEALVKPDSGITEQELVTSLEKAIADNAEATRYTPGKGSGKLDKIFRALLPEGHELKQDMKRSKLNKDK